jgi:hypothetical protein
MKITIFCDIKPCNSLIVNRRFEGTNSLHLHDQSISRAINQHESRFLSRFILRLYGLRWCVPPKRRLNFNGLHGFISQKIVIFITNTVMISYRYDVESVVLTTLVMKISVVWDIMSCSPLKFKRRFGGAALLVYCFIHTRCNQTEAYGWLNCWVLIMVQ